MKALIWDFDGTLGYNDNMWSGTLTQVLNRAMPNLSVVRDDLRPYMSGGYPWSEPEIFHGPKDGDRWWADLRPLFETALDAVGVDASHVESVLAQFRQHYIDLDNWGVFDDVMDCLSAYRERGWRHFILSNHVPELPEIVCGLGLDQYFEIVVTSADVGYEKPNPNLYRYLLEQLGTLDAAWMIGDNYKADVLGAEAVGLDAVLVRGDHPDAKYKCATLYDLASIIDKSSELLLKR